MIQDIFNIYADDRQLSEGFTNFLVKVVLQEKAKNRIALSGGSTPKAIFDYWSENCRDVLPWQDMYFFWGDERMVLPDDGMSNYGMARKHLFDRVPVPQNNIFRIYGENEANDEALYYSSLLEDEVELQNGIPSFDLLMLGLGEDGHTVSVFPYQIGLWDSAEFCVVANHPESQMDRVTITGQVVNNAQYVAFLVTGKNKAQRVQDIIRHRERFADLYPAARVNPVSQELHWFLDEEAASLL